MFIIIKQITAKMQGEETHKKSHNVKYKTHFRSCQSHFITV